MASGLGPLSQSAADAAIQNGLTDAEPDLIPMPPGYDPAAAGRDPESLRLSGIAKWNAIVDAARAPKANPFGRSTSLLDGYRGPNYSAREKAEWAAYAKAIEQHPEPEMFFNTPRPLIYDQSLQKAPVLSSGQGYVPGGLSEVSAVDSFFTFNKLGRTLTGISNSAKGLWNSLPNLSIGWYHLTSDGYGYAKDAVFGPKQGLMMPEPYAAKSGIVQSIQNNGWLGATGNFMHSTVKSLPVVGFIDAGIRNDYDGMGSGVFNTALWGISVFARGNVANSTGPTWVELKSIRSTQATISVKTGEGVPVLNVASEMKLNGWDLSKGAPDLVQLDNGFMTLDHRRLVAADWAGREMVPGNIHGFNEQLPLAFKQSARFSSFESPVAFSDVGTRTTFYRGDLPDTWGQAGMIRSLQQQERFGQFPITGSSNLPSFTFKDANDWARYINHLERFSNQ